MSDIDDLRRILEEPPPTEETRDRARGALRAQYAAREPRRHRLGKLALGALAAVLAVIAVISMRIGQAEAWSPEPQTPPESSLVAAAPNECGVADVGDESPPLTDEPPLLIDQRNDVAVAMFGDRSASDRTSSFLTCTLVFTDGSWRRPDGDLPFDLAVTAGSVDEELLGQRVERVVIETEPETIEVSYRDGFYLMWWPEELALTDESMRFVASDGSVLLEIPVQGRGGNEP